MAIPFFSIDVRKPEISKLLKGIFFPFNTSLSEQKLKLILEGRFPNKKIALLPSARIGFYLTLKKYFKENDEIIFSSMSFPLYIKIANQLNLKVRLVDVNPNDLNINAEKIEKNINKNTKAIVVTHLFGYPCEIEKIRKIAKENNILLIEDCAQSFNSKFKGIKTGYFGDVGIFSFSLVKVPTTLGGGMIITEDLSLVEFIENWKNENLNNSFKNHFSFLIKNILTIFNSIPFFYTLLSSNIFFFLNRFNPRVYRKIVYSGMGIRNKVFDPKERNNLSKYQINFGISQLEKYELMKSQCKKNSVYLKENLKNIDNISFLNYDDNVNWNYQYFVIKIKKNYEQFNKKLFDQGIHSMEENVWNCLEYNLTIENNEDDFKNTLENSKKLLRIQNSSYLTKKHLDKIINSIKLSAKN